MAMKVVYTTINGVVVHEDRNGTQRNYRPDTLGNTVALTDATTATDTMTYWPYGEIRTRTGTNVTRFLFVGTLGYSKDGGSGILHYVRARYYQASRGRWVTIDPLWPGQPTYAYCNDLPHSFTDWWGYSPQDVAEGTVVHRHGGGREAGGGCCDPLPSTLPPDHPTCRRIKAYCESCAKLEGFSSIAALCAELSKHDKRKPKFPGVGALRCAREHAQAAADYGIRHCPPGTKDFDKCRHCMASCYLTNKCGAAAAEYTGWLRERAQLLDCKKGGYGSDDHDANLVGIRGAPYCRTACKRFRPR